MSLTFAQASEACRLDSSEPASAPLPSANSTSDAAACSSAAGLASQSTETCVIAMGFPCQDLSVAGKRAGLSGSQSSLLYAILGLLPRTSSIRGGSGCPSCGSACTSSGIPACLFNCQPLKLEGVTTAGEFSLWPTPTASAYGSCRGGGAGRVGKWRKSLQALGILNPGDWERMMGFPIGHTDVSSSVTPSSPTLPNSSLEPSELV